MVFGSNGRSVKPLPFDELQKQVNGLQQDWISNFVNPYFTCYSNAHAAFKSTLDDQKEIDKLIGELFVCAASVVTGSILISAFAVSAARTAVFNKTLDIICNRNNDVAFRALDAVSSDKALVFAFGKMLDKMKDISSDSTKNYFKNTMSATIVPPQGQPAQILTSLSQFVNASRHAVEDFIEEVKQDSRISDSERMRLSVLLQETPFWNPPTAGAINIDTISKYLEYSMYMSLILSSDFVEEYSEGPDFISGDTVQTTTNRSPIGAPPSDKTNYPIETPAEHAKNSIWSTKNGIKITFDNPGISFAAKINVLSKDIFHRYFFRSRFSRLKKRYLSKAEKDLYALSDLCRPISLDEIRDIKEI